MPAALMIPVSEFAAGRKKSADFRSPSAAERQHRNDKGAQNEEWPAEEDPLEIADLYSVV